MSLGDILEEVCALEGDIAPDDPDLRNLELRALRALAKEHGEESELIGEFILLRNRFPRDDPGQWRVLFFVFRESMKALLERSMAVSLYYVDKEKERFEAFAGHPTEDGHYVVDTIPAGGSGFAPKDVIATREEEGRTCFDRVVERSGNKVVRFIYVGPVDAVAEAFVQEVEALEGRIEHMFSSVVLVHFPKTVSTQTISTLLKKHNINTYDYAHRSIRSGG